MSVETRTLSRSLLKIIAKARAVHGTKISDQQIVECCWDLAELWDREGRSREAIEEKSYIPPVITKETDK